MKIKQTPEDFQVEELINLKLKARGEYTYVELEKKNWTTARAIKQIARKLRISKTRIGFAGNKDKHAVTKQVISIWKMPAEQINRIKLKDIKLKVVGFGDQRICLGDLVGNRFKIVIRELNKSELQRFKINFSKLKRNGFPNYFGEQRFGVAKNTHLVGKCIIKGDLEGAVRVFLIKSTDNEECQKFVRLVKEQWGNWNALITACPKFLGLEKSVLNWLIKNPTDFAGALRTITKPTRKLFVNAYQSWLWNKELHKLIKAGKVPAELPIPPMECKRMPELSTAGTIRATFVKPKKVCKRVKDNVITLTFELPKGSYATVFIRELFGG